MFELRTEACEVGGHLKVRVTVAEDGRVVDGELVAPFNGRQRRAVAERMASRVAGAGDAQEATADEVERRVLEAAEQYRWVQKGKDDKNADPHAGEVLEDAVEAEDGRHAVVRPELFVTPAVVGVGIPETVRSGDVGLSGRWRLYLTTPADGKRWREELRGEVAVPGVSTGVWVRPVPGDPSLPTNAGWSSASRKAWLAGAATPTAREAFAAVYAALDEYLDVGQGTEEMGRWGAGEMGGADASAPHPPTAPSPHPVLSTLTLWTLLTYCFPAWDAVPYLYVGGPAGSGKTRVFELLSRLVFRPLASSNVSAPALFRTLHERGGTLLLDEAERLKEGAPEVAEVRSILLAGYKRGGKASRLESTGDGQYRMQDFDVFGPKAIACIAGVEGPLATRCIGVQMIRSAPDSPRPKRRVDRDPSRWPRLRDTLHTCLLGELGRSAPLLSESPEVCPLGGRAGELWQPLLALATLVDQEDKWGLHQVMAKHATEQAELGKDEHFPQDDLLLLTVLTKKVLKGEFPTPRDLLQSCLHKDDRFAGRWTASRVSLCLRLYGIKSIRARQRREYHVAIDHLKMIERNYGIDLNTEGRQPQVLIRRY